MDTQSSAELGGLGRRTLLRLGAAGGLSAALAGAKVFAVPGLEKGGLLSGDGAFAGTSTALSDLLFYIEKYPTSPLIMSPFKDALTVPQALRPIPLQDFSAWASPPGPGVGQQNSLGNEQHQIWTKQLNCPDPIVYRIELQVRPHSFTTSKVMPIDAGGKPTVSFDASGKTYAAGTIRDLPASTIYGFNGTFPGPMINAEYGKPALVRFDNALDENPLEPGPPGLRRAGLVVPDAPAQRPHRAGERRQPALLDELRPEDHGYRPQHVVRQPLPQLARRQRRPREAELLLVPRPPHGPDRVQRLQGHGRPLPDLRPEERPGHGRRALGSAPPRRPHATTRTGPSTSTTTSRWRSTTAGSTTASRRTRTCTTASASSRPPHNPTTHPEWWGKTFFKHFPKHGFVGDIFTVNGTAFPVLNVKRRKYRFRFLDASVPASTSSSS